MFTLIFSGLATILHLLLAPWQWFTSLPLIDWQLPIIVVLFTAIFYKRVIVHAVMAKYAIMDWIADQSYVREWNHYAGMNNQEFCQAVEALEGKSKREEEAATRLQNRARQGVRIPGGADSMYEEARRRRERSLRLLNEIKRLKELRAEIEKQELAQGGGAKRVMGLMDQLASRDRNQAEKALAQLNKLGMAFDWNRLVPANLPDQTRQLIIKTMRLMASTSSVDEAQTARGRVLKLLENYGMSWGDMAA